METMGKIDIRDLSIGDWVRVRMCKWDYDGTDTLDAKVLAIEGNSVGVGYDECGIVMSAFVDDLQPILITAEVLEKNGLHEAEFGLVVKPKSDKLCASMGVSIEIKYIHELQHILRLTKTKKEIVL